MSAYTFENSVIHPAFYMRNHSSSPTSQLYVGAYEGSDNSGSLGSSSGISSWRTQSPSVGNRGRGNSNVIISKVISESQTKCIHLVI